MKIVRIIARLNIGGPAIQAITLSHDLQAAGHRSILIAGALPPGEGSMEYLAEEMGVEVVHLTQLSRRLSVLNDLRSFWRLYRLLRRERPDLVHTHTAKAGTVGRLAAICAGVPRVHTFHGHVFQGYFSPAMTRVFLAVERWLGRRTDRIVAISESQLQELSGTYRIAPPEKFAVIRLGFDLGRFAPVADQRQPDGEAAFTVGWVGRLTEIKDPDLLLDVAAASRAVLPHARFAVAGDGHLRSRLEAKAAEMQLDGRLQWIGWQRDMAPWLAQWQALLLTSRNEGTPVAIIEAMASGCAVVAADVGGVRDLMAEVVEQHDGYSVCRNGLLVHRREAAVFCAALQWLAADAERRRALGQAAREWIVPRYSRERLVRDTLDLYRPWMNQKHAGDSPAR